METSFSPVKQKAVALKLPVTQPEKIKNNEEFRLALSEIRPDAIIVVGYGRIVPQWMLDLPRFGNLNLHASLLPKYRGAAPIQWAIASGEAVTGVTTMRIDSGLDTGDILLQEKMAVGPENTAETLSPKLAAIGAELMARTLEGLNAETIRPRPQNHAEATLAPILKKEDGRIDFQRSAHEIGNRLRGFQPWPGASTTFRGKNLNLWKAIPAERRVPQGEMMAVDKQLFLGCGQNTSLEILELQLEGKRRMAASDFIQGYRPTAGERLGS